MPLPNFDAFQRVWVEKTKCNHGHGGTGWELGHERAVFAARFFSHLTNSAKFFATRVTNSEMGSMTKACMGNSISSGLDVENLPIL